MKMIGTWCAALLAGFLAVGTAAETVEIRDNSGNIVGRADLDGYYSSDELNRKLDEARKDMQRLLEEQRRKAADETARQVRQRSKTSGRIRPGCVSKSSGKSSA